MSEKVVYVPRSWNITISNGDSYSLRANEEYRIVMADGSCHDMTIGNIVNKDGKTFIIPKVLMYRGAMNVMKKVSTIEIDAHDIENISAITTSYNRANRSSHDIDGKNSNSFTFAFDTDKYSSQYRITIYQGEFVCLALKNNYESMRSTRSIYGHIVDAGIDNGEMIFMRYVSKSGVRDVYPISVKMDTLLGIYRYELGIEVEETATEK